MSVGLVFGVIIRYNEKTNFVITEEKTYGTSRLGPPFLCREEPTTFFQQKQLLDTFLSHHTISKEQYDKSLGDLTVKMGMENEVSGENSERITRETDFI